jgi:hypothetical protein
MQRLSDKMEEKAKKALEDVRLFTDYWGFPNTFSLYLDKTGELFENKDIRGFADFKNYRFVINCNALSKEFFREEVASILAFLQPYANFYEETGEEFRLKQSKLFPGICKKVELEVDKRLEKVGYKFSEIESELFSFLLDESNQELIKGFRIAEKIASLVPEEFPKKDLVYKAIIRAASKFDHLDKGFEELLKIAYRSINDIYILADLAVNKPPLDVMEVENKVNFIYKLIGEKAQSREIKLNLKELSKLLERGGAPRKLLEASKKVYSKLDGSLLEWEVLSAENEHMLREFLESVKSEFILEVKPKGKEKYA